MLESLSLEEALAGLGRGEFSGSELTLALLARIELLNPVLGAYGHWDSEASAVEPKQVGPLGGLPFTLKDNMNLAETATRAGSAILEGYVSPYDCTAAARLMQAGGRYLGKTNMDEFAMGSSTEYSVYGPTRNPWDIGRSAGGSSGGSAAAVAADLALFALGSDTGGSIRQPAAMCGVVGVKPSYGRVSRYGLVAFASSLDQIGPITKSVPDAALVLELIMGFDPRDATSRSETVPPLLAETRRDLNGLRFGIPAGLTELGMSEGVAAALESAAEALAQAGATRVEIELPHLRYVVAGYYLLATAEASSNLARYDGVRYGSRADGAESLDEMYRSSRSRGFGAEAKRRIMLGTFALSSGYYDDYYLKAQKLRTLVMADFDAAFAGCDCIVMPTTPSPAFELGEKIDDPLAMYLGDVFTLPANLAGLPAASVPTAELGGLPLGTQLIGRSFDEATLLRFAAALERAFPFGELRRKRVAAALAEGGAP